MADVVAESVLRMAVFLAIGFALGWLWQKARLWYRK